MNKLSIDRHLPFTGCKICGGKLCIIRGKYPNNPEREVCPTCLMEKLESIYEISSPNYKIPSQEKV